MGPSLTHASTLKFSATAGFGLIELASASGLRAQLLPTGALFALRHEGTLINQFLPGPAEDGLFRLLLRWQTAAGDRGWMPLVGPTVPFHRCGPAAVVWSADNGRGLAATTVLQLHPRLPAWAWRVTVHHTGAMPCRVDVFHAQDLGLADEGAVRNNEAYTSQYLDLLPLPDAELGWILCARQNQAMAGGRFPWLGLACATGAAAHCTDGSQFFGADHRLTGEPLAVRAPSLPSRRLQQEFALGGLQSRAVELAPGASTSTAFVAHFQPDHPAASGPADQAQLRALLPLDWIDVPATPAPAAAPPASVFFGSSWAHGDAPSAGDLQVWFPGEHRQVESGPDGRRLSFFHGDATHVVARDKEAAMARPHGHILRSGTARWIDDEQFGLTCYAAGIFGAQAYLANPSFTRLLSVVRNSLNVARASGQRVFVRRRGGAWRQLGVPSAFAMQPGEVRWIYRFGTELVTARVWCARGQPVSFLELKVEVGAPVEFLVTHQLVLGATEFEFPAEAELHAAAGWVAFRANEQSLMGRLQPEVSFALAAADAGSVAAWGGDGLLHPDEAERGGPYATLRTQPVTQCGVILLGTTAGAKALPAAVAAARAEFAAGRPAAVPPTAPLRLQASRDPGVARIDEILPWFAHNAAIHFSAPHGLEQCGGAAWGVRDVCQGSVEWLLAAGEFAVVRRLLQTVFAQQYPADGAWPQWFMHAPFGFIQQQHSHGDVCFWPVKALCDYVEASNDFDFLTVKVGYTDPAGFAATGPQESLWAHCDRVIAQCEARFVPGTALVNYGDGDWDDTLQPADPAMRTRMVSAWTVGLAFHAFRQLAAVSRRAGTADRAVRLERLLERMRRDFIRFAMPGGVTAGFLVHEPDGSFRPLLHPTDRVTGIRYRLLPMTRSMLAELFTPEEAARHAALIERELRFTDGVRLMSEPAAYRGGLEKLFKRAETAANVGREIGLQYVHAHIRYAEAMAKLGEADRLWWALQVVNPVALEKLIPGALARQSNVYSPAPMRILPIASRPRPAGRNSAPARCRCVVAGGFTPAAPASFCTKSARACSGCANRSAMSCSIRCCRAASTVSRWTPTCWASRCS
ncbi:MAG: GH36-type glycosyl hydrolase domain-containing protein [Opitutales bacterium]